MLAVELQHFLSVIPYASSHYSSTLSSFFLTPIQARFSLVGPLPQFTACLQIQVPCKYSLLTLTDTESPGSVWSHDDLRPTQALMSRTASATSPAFFTAAHKPDSQVYGKWILTPLFFHPRVRYCTLPNVMCNLPLNFFLRVTTCVL
jgi:hypothetical protein